MDYILATLSNRNTNLEIGIMGNKYQVSIYDTDTKEFTLNKFDSIDKAYYVFEKISSFIIFGLYSDKQRRNYLMTGKI